jgi:hypothetical protein
MVTKNKRRKIAIGEAIHELSLSVNRHLEIIQIQIEHNIPPSTYKYTVNYLQEKVNEIIEILAKEW